MELHEQIASQASRLEGELDHLQWQLELNGSQEYSEDQILLALNTAKRVRRADTLLIKQLAKLLEHLQT